MFVSDSVVTAVILDTTFIRFQSGGAYRSTEASCDCDTIVQYTIISDFCSYTYIEKALVGALSEHSLCITVHSIDNIIEELCWWPGMQCYVQASGSSSVHGGEGSSLRWCQSAGGAQCSGVTAETKSVSDKSQWTPLLPGDQRLISDNWPDYCLRKHQLEHHLLPFNSFHWL